MIVCSLLAGASACFSDKGSQVAGDSTGEPTTGNEDSGEVTGDNTDPAIVALCSEDLTRRDTILTAQCQCQVDQGKFEDVATCLASGARKATPTCICDVYGAHAEIRTGLECAAPGQADVITCLEGLSCAQNTTTFDACIETYYTAISTCGAPPKIVAGQVAIQCEDVSPFVCGEGEGIPETWKCDLAADCVDGSDEATCPGTFMCDDGEIVDEELVCDEFPDCADESDEKKCPTFVCTSGTVIPLSYRCDGVTDCCPDAPDPEVCADKSDEANCPTFTCADGMTIALMFKCDGIEDCDDKSDELGCSP